MHTRLLVAGGVLLALVLGGFLWLSHAGQAVPSASAVQPSALPTSTASLPVPRSPGIPAIVPHLPSPLLAPGTGGARFTAADVTAYLHTHPFPSGPVVAGATEAVVGIDFISSQQASQRLHGETIGVPDTALVCYVTLHGPFTMKNVQPAPGTAPLPPVAIGVEVFDAQTGNLLLWWVP